MTSLEPPVEIVPYDSSWPGLFTAEAEVLHHALRPWLTGPIEHWFCKPSPAVRTHHLHLVPMGSSQWVQPIAFRNYLRARADVAQEYEALKRRLAEVHHNDREAYTRAKRPFIARVTALALETGLGSQ